MFWVVRWLGKLGWLGQFIWLIGWMVSVVKWLGCWNQEVRMIYQILSEMEIVSWGMIAIMQEMKKIDKISSQTDLFMLMRQYD